MYNNFEDIYRMSQFKKFPKEAMHNLRTKYVVFNDAHLTDAQLQLVTRHLVNVLGKPIYKVSDTVFPYKEIVSILDEQVYDMGAKIRGLSANEYAALLKTNLRKLATNKHKATWEPQYTSIFAEDYNNVCHYDGSSMYASLWGEASNNAKLYARFPVIITRTGMTRIAEYYPNAVGARNWVIIPTDVYETPYHKKCADRKLTVSLYSARTQSYYNREASAFDKYPLNGRLWTADEVATGEDKILIDQFRTKLYDFTDRHRELLRMVQDTTYNQVVPTNSAAKGISTDRVEILPYAGPASNGFVDYDRQPNQAVETTRSRHGLFKEAHGINRNLPATWYNDLQAEYVQFLIDHPEWIEEIVEPDRICPHCSHAINPYMEFCDYCGELNPNYVDVDDINPDWTPDDPDYDLTDDVCCDNEDDTNENELWDSAEAEE